MPDIAFTVVGKPEQAGSKKWLPRKGIKGARPIITDDNPRAKQWMRAVGMEARIAMMQHEIITGPCELHLVFYMPRTKDHYGTGRNAGKLKDSAPLYPTKKPDTTKLVRAVEDGMKGIVWLDDSQVVDQTAKRRYADDGKPRVEVLVRAIDI